MSSYSDRYPLTKRDEVRPLRELLSAVPGLPARQAEDLAHAINDLADKASDLDDIFKLLTGGVLERPQIAELFSAFELTLEQIRGRSDEINGKLYDLSDRLAVTMDPAEKGS